MLRSWLNSIASIGFVLAGSSNARAISVAQSIDGQIGEDHAIVAEIYASIGLRDIGSALSGTRVLRLSPDMKILRISDELRCLQNECLTIIAQNTDGLWRPAAIFVAHRHVAIANYFFEWLGGSATTFIFPGPHSSISLIQTRIGFVARASTPEVGLDYSRDLWRPAPLPEPRPPPPETFETFRRKLDEFGR